MNTWTTRDGRRLHLSELGDQHLLNCIRMVERRAVVMDRVESAGVVISDTSQLGILKSRLLLSNMLEEAQTRELPLMGLEHRMLSLEAYEAICDDIADIREAEERSAIYMDGTKWGLPGDLF